MTPPVKVLVTGASGHVGRSVYLSLTETPSRYDVYALFADGRLLRMASSADQPTWVWNSDALGYRDLLSPGITLLPSLQAMPRQLASGARLAWPTFSPDGRRMAYAALDAGGVEGDDQLAGASRLEDLLIDGGDRTIALTFNFPDLERDVSRVPELEGVAYYCALFNLPPVVGELGEGELGIGKGSEGE